MMKSSQKLSPVVALLSVLASIFIVNGIGYKVQGKIRNNREKTCVIQRVSHSCANAYSLPLTYILELLDFSKGEQSTIDLRKLGQYSKSVLKSPLIREARVSVSGDVFHLDYELNFPKAKLYDFKNVLVDERGLVLPENPFYKSLKLPKICLGTEQVVSYGTVLRDIRLKTAMQFLVDYQKLLDERGFAIECIDMQNFFHSSIGKRQVVLKLVKNKKSFLLRLATQDFSDAFERFYSIEKKLKKEENIVDLRIKDVAIFL